LAISKLVDWGKLGRELFYSWYEIQVVKADRQDKLNLGD